MHWQRQYIPEPSNQQNVGDLVNAYGKENSQIREIFAEGGDLSQAQPGYSYRDPQHRAAQMAGHAFRLRKPTMIEAGTGTGKSHAFAVPAVLHALSVGKPIVLSTSNNVLIDQYSRKDLPTLQRALERRLTSVYGRNFTFSTAKGRGHYLCKRALMSLLRAGRPDRWHDALELIRKWELTTETGDLAEVTGFDLKASPLGSKIAATRDNCDGRMKCAYGQECYFYAQQERWQSSDIIVTNHAMLVLSLVNENFILPEFDGYIVDEAHQLERYCTEWLTIRSSYERWSKLLGSASEWLRKPYEDVLDLARVWFDTLKPERTPRMPNKLLDGARLIVDELVAKEIGDGLRDAIQEQILAIRSVCDSSSHRDRAAWIERKDSKNGEWHYHVIHSAPVNVGSFLKWKLWTKPGVITSATLCTEEGPEAFDYAKRQLGVDTSLTLQLSSPFDWKSNCLYLLSNPRAIGESDCTKRNSETYEEFAERWALKLTPTCGKLLEITQGRAFIICTRTAVSKHLAENLRKLVGYPIRHQSELSKPDMLAWFRSTPQAVLVATASYREGVDIAGDQLSLVIADCLEFPNGNDPLESAKMEAMGKSAFQLYQVPYCKTVLRQTVGRLIRTASDRGIFVLLDPRVHSKRYGRDILASLPGDAVSALNRTGQIDVTGFLEGRVNAQGQLTRIDSDGPAPVATESQIAEDIEGFWAVLEGNKPVSVASEKFSDQLERSGLKNLQRLTSVEDWGTDAA